MTRDQLEHILRAAGTLTDQTDIVVIGSQAILGSQPDAPGSLLVSVEADVFPLHRPDLSDLIDGTIGELSPFHNTFGYYGHGVAPETAVLPREWKQRLVKVCNSNTNGITGWCLHPIDIAYSKLAAGRTKDIEYLRDLLKHQLVDAKALTKLIKDGSQNSDLLLSRLKVASRDPEP